MPVSVFIRLNTILEGRTGSTALEGSMSVILSLFEPFRVTILSEDVSFSITIDDWIDWIRRASFGERRCNMAE